MKNKESPSMWVLIIFGAMNFPEFLSRPDTNHTFHVAIWHTRFFQNVEPAVVFTRVRKDVCYIFISWISFSRQKWLSSSSSSGRYTLYHPINVRRRWIFCVNYGEKRAGKQPSTVHGVSLRRNLNYCCCKKKKKTKTLIKNDNKYDLTIINIFNSHRRLYVYEDSLT
jgi:hypothetical protein